MDVCPHRHYKTKSSISLIRSYPSGATPQPGPKKTPKAPLWLCASRLADSFAHPAKQGAQTGDCGKPHEEQAPEAKGGFERSHE